MPSFATTVALSGACALFALPAAAASTSMHAGPTLSSLITGWLHSPSLTPPACLPPWLSCAAPPLPEIANDLTSRLSGAEKALKSVAEAGQDLSNIPNVSRQRAAGHGPWRCTCAMDMHSSATAQLPAAEWAAHASCAWARRAHRRTWL